MTGTTAKMVVDLVTILHGHGMFVVDSIRRNMSAAGVDATGRTSKSLKYEVKQEGSKTILKVTGKPFIMVIETGRKATPSYKPSSDFVKSIKEWAASKGIDTRFAYSIAKSIHKEGTKGTPGLISDVINQSLIDKIAKDSLEKFAAGFMKNIVAQYGRNSN